MSEKTFNPKLEAVVSIRNLVCGLATDWKALRSYGAEIDKTTEKLSTTFINNASIIAHERWLKEREILNVAVKELKAILNEVIRAINAKNGKNLTSIWNKHQTYAATVKSSLENLKLLGEQYLTANFQTNWTNDWQQVFEQYDAIQALVVGSNLHLQMIENYAPEEVDELTDTILKNMPSNYTIEDAKQYEKEYMAAYEQLKAAAIKKKNLWDRFLDLLAGGTQQTPAEIVMMQRWVNGEKGNL